MYTCKVAGDGPDLEELIRLCRDLPVEFVGRVSADQVPPLVASHDVYLFPSNFEGLPLTLIEVMSGGCVPVASRLKNVTDQIIEEGVSGYLIEPGNIEGFVDRFDLLAKNSDQRKQMSEAARYRMQRLFFD